MGPLRALVLTAGCVATAARAADRVEITHTAMGTTFRIMLYAEASAPAAAAAGRAFAEMDAVEAALSDYRSDSAIARLGAAAGGAALPVSPLTAEALRAARRFAEETQGAFDPTVAPVVQLWRAARASGRLPPADAARAAFALVGWRELEVGEQTARLARVGMRLDLGGIGKGFACDRALASLRGAGFARALVAAGGDHAAGDPPPGELGWRIRIDESGPVLTVSRCGVSTSGDSVQHADIGGRRYSHIIDPRTGRPVEGMGFVTVIAENATASDALATALSVLGPEAGLALATRRPATRARIRWRAGAETRTVTTPGFDTPTVPDMFRFLPGTVEVTLAGRPFTTYRYANSDGTPLRRPFFSPVLADDGTPVTADQLTAGGDHPHHRSLWVGHGDVNGTDHWGTNDRTPGGPRQLPRGLPVVEGNA
ncbi:MAG: FAD:protein FMN transferase, partial [bacterium]